MKYQKIIEAAVEAAKNEKELEYVFEAFRVIMPKDKAMVLQRVIGGQWFDLPRDDEMKYQIMLQAFLSAHWRHANNLSKIKELVNSELP